MCLNSLYDPLQPGGANTQPRWYEQLAAIYEKYACYAAKMSVICLGAEKMADVGIACYDTSAPASMRELGERDQCQKKTIDISTNGGRNSVLTFTAFYDFAKILGLPRNQYINDTSFWVQNTADPGKKVYFNFYVQGLAAQTASVTFQWTIQFYAKMGNVEDPADS